LPIAKITAPGEILCGRSPAVADASDGRGMCSFAFLVGEVAE